MKSVSSVLTILALAGNLIIYCITNALFRRVIGAKIKKLFTAVCPLVKRLTRTRCFSLCDTNNSTYSTGPLIIIRFSRTIIRTLKGRKATRDQCCD
jgi:hypothetical protein